ncbi:MAG: RidA family protein [Pseudomonadales bacterium]|jgi:enamine deaminase RidA (YjgF/YER057c/UK114 family)|nr:RidA family protein [Pseudomonadales bacterium]
MTETHVRDPGGVLYDRFHFAQAVRAGGLLLCSGQLGTRADGTVPEEFSEEAMLAWAAVGRVLAEAGLAFADVVEVTSYHVGLQQGLPDFMAARDAHLAAPWPAWTAIGVSELAVPGARVEIRVIARL